MAFDSSQVREWSDNRAERDILNADAVNNFCRKMVEDNFPSLSEWTAREHVAASWINSVFRKHLLTKSVMRMIITPREALMGRHETIHSMGVEYGRNLSVAPTITMDPATLPDFVLDKMRLGLPVWWLTLPVSWSPSLKEIVHYLRFKAKASPNIGEDFEQLTSKIRARKKQARVKRLVRENSWDVKRVPSSHLEEGGFYAVQLMTKHAFEREGFLMRNCIHNMWNCLTTDSARMYSIRKKGEGRPIGDLYAEQVNGRLVFSSFAGFANKRTARISEALLHAFAAEIGVNNLPVRMNLDRTAAGMWGDFQFPELDFTVASQRSTEVDDTTRVRQMDSGQMGANWYQITFDSSAGGRDVIITSPTTLGNSPRDLSSPELREVDFDWFNSYARELWDDILPRLAEPWSSSARVWADSLITLVPTPVPDNLRGIQSQCRLLRLKERPSRQQEFIFNVNSRDVFSSLEEKGDNEPEESEPRSPWRTYDPQLLLGYTPRRSTPDFWYTSFGMGGFSMGGWFSCGKSLINTNII